MKEKIKQILIDIYQIDGRLEDQATESIFRLFNISEFTDEEIKSEYENRDLYDPYDPRHSCWDD